MRGKITLLFILLCAGSCEKVMDWPQNKNSVPVLVVDGMITNERTAQEIKLSYPSADFNEPSTPVSNAIVTINAGKNIYLLHEDAGEPGSYYTDPDVQGVSGIQYKLYIQVNGKTFTATAYMVPVEPLAPFEYDPCGDGYKAKFSDTGDPHMTELILDWSGTPECNGTSGCNARIIHYDLNNIDVNKVFKPAQEEVCFPAGTVVIRKKYSLTPEYQEFLRSMLSETEWKGGYFDVESGNVSTNLSNGAVGYFSACTVVSDTVIVQ